MQNILPCKVPFYFIIRQYSDILTILSLSLFTGFFVVCRLYYRLILEKISSINIKQFESRLGSTFCQGQNCFQPTTVAASRENFMQIFLLSTTAYVLVKKLEK